MTGLGLGLRGDDGGQHDGAVNVDARRPVDWRAISPVSCDAVVAHWKVLVTLLNMDMESLLVVMKARCRANLPERDRFWRDAIPAGFTANLE